MSNLVNAKRDGNGNRTDQPYLGPDWRAFPKVSYNEYLDDYYYDPSTQDPDDAQQMLLNVIKLRNLSYS